MVSTFSSEGCRDVVEMTLPPGNAIPAQAVGSSFATVARFRAAVRLNLGDLP
jgi:hypothetical protein